MGHVLFARPDELDRRARHLLGDRHRLADIIDPAPAAEAAAAYGLVHIALADRQARLLRRRRERRLPVLSGAPDLAFVRRIERGHIHRLPGGVVLVWIVVSRLDRSHGAPAR